LAGTIADNASAWAGLLRAPPRHRARDSGRPPNAVRHNVKSTAAQTADGHERRKDFLGEAELAALLGRVRADQYDSPHCPIRKRIKMVVVEIAIVCIFVFGRICNGCSPGRSWSFARVSIVKGNTWRRRFNWPRYGNRLAVPRRADAV
jgi:hypothetical protein